MGFGGVPKLFSFKQEAEQQPGIRYRPALVLPETSVSELPLELTPKRIKHWLAGLPLTNLGQSASILYKTLHDLNRCKIPVDKRIRFVTAIDAHFDQIISALNKLCNGNSSPVISKNRKIHRLIDQLLYEKAIAHKHIVNGQIEARHRIDTRFLANHVFSTLHALDGILINSYRTYARQPQNLWKEIHYLYIFARKNDFHLLKIKTSAAEHEKETTIEDLYKSILLMFLCSPYQLKAHELSCIHGNILDWAHNTQLVPLGSSSKPTQPFVINVGSDNPPVHKEFFVPGENAVIFALETSGLVRNLNNPAQISYASSGLTQSLLNRLALNWSVAQRRSFSRIRKNTPIESLMGFENIHSIVSNASNTIDNPSVVMVRDISAEGYCIVCKLSDDLDARIGNLIALRVKVGADEYIWNIGVIRRMLVGESALELGIQILSMATMPITTKIHDSRYTTYSNGFLVPEVKWNKEQPATLLTVLNQYHVGDTILVNSGGIESRVQLTEMIDNTGSYSRFTFRVIDDVYKNVEKEKAQRYDFEYICRLI